MALIVFDGSEKNDIEKIPLIYENASDTLGALKMIRPIDTRQKVPIIFSRSFIPGRP